MTSLLSLKKLIVLLLLTTCYFLLAPSSYAQSPDQCSIIGNNLAVPFPSGNTWAEAQFTLASVGAVEDQAAVISAIAAAPSGSIIVRVGTQAPDRNPVTNQPIPGSGNSGPEASAYASMLQAIAASDDVGGKEFYAMVTHNEPNCAEASPLSEEITFANTVIAGVSAGNVHFITGQVDTYCNNAPNIPLEADPSSGLGYLRGYVNNISGIEAISLPLYITPNYPTGDQAYTLLSQMQQASGLPAFVTESGPYTGDMAAWIDAAQRAVQDPNIRGLLLFNALGINPDPEYIYTSPFWDPLCRETLRTNCGDTDAVLAACDNATAIIEEGDHLCRNLCQGTLLEPCALTPGFDCSIPFNTSEILGGGPYDLDPFRQQKEQYIREILNNSITNHGVDYQFNAQVFNEEVCAEPIDPVYTFLASQCNNLQGDGATVDDFSNVTLNTLSPPVNTNIVNERLTYPRGYTNHSGCSPADPVSCGIVQKQSSDPEWRIRMSHLMQFKEYCYQNGLEPIIPFIDHGYYGRIRCANFVEFNCPACTITNERDLWIADNAPLRICVTDPTSVACALALEDLPSPLKTQLKLQSDVPVATFPIIGGIDEISSSAEASFSFTNIVTQFLNVLNPDPIMPIEGETDADPRLPSTATTYYIYSAVLAQDNAISGRLVNEHMTPAVALIEPDNLPDPIDSYDFNTFSAGFTAEHIPLYLELAPDQPGPAFQDPRIRLIQKFFNHHFSQCLENVEDTDYTTNDKPIQIYDAVGNAFVNTVIATFDSLVFSATSVVTNLPQTYELQRYVRCEIIPSLLQDSDDYGIDFADRLTQGFVLPRIDDITDREIQSTVELESDGAWRAPDLECVENTQGLVPDPPPTDPVTGEPLPVNGPPLCYSYECNGDGLPACPLASPVTTWIGSVLEFLNRNPDDPSPGDGIRETTVDSSDTSTDAESWETKVGGIFTTTESFELSQYALKQQVLTCPEDVDYYIQWLTGCQGQPLP